MYYMYRKTHYLIELKLLLKIALTWRLYK